MNRIILLAATMVTMSACSVRTYCFECGQDASTTVDASDASHSNDSTVGDASCIAFPETCNGIDDDCDGLLDENDPDIDGVGNACNESAAGLCGGVLRCEAGTTDGTLTCVGSTTPSVEKCDGVDNDCDGFIDETEDDDAHQYLAESGRPCWALPDGTAIPRAGICRAGTTSCSEALHMIVCEGAIGPSVELCDNDPMTRNADENCDGVIDEGAFTSAGVSSTDALAVECSFVRGSATIHGHNICANGMVTCVSNTVPMPENCDGMDNDLDGVIDNGILDRDVNNCGACGHACTSESAFAHAENVNIRCVDQTPSDAEALGTCVLDSTLPCAEGYYNIDGDWTNGCEYRCTPNGAELCNGRDDDCDGATDEEADIAASRPNICVTVGPCADMRATCSGSGGWVCDYEAYDVARPEITLEVTRDERARQVLVTNEARCDAQDNNCNGRTDERFVTLGQTCTRGLGACTTTGVVECLGDASDVYCHADEPPDYSSVAESCNGIDDDCDGATDEGDLDAWVSVNGEYRIYQYEASHPDGTATNLGAISARSCSVPGRLPWINVTHAQAAAACEAIGARLCTGAEWARACGGSDECVYGTDLSCNTYASGQCNDGAYEAGLLATGALSSTCYAAWSESSSGRVYDLNGNVAEWTASYTSGSDTFATIYGGSYTTPGGAGMMCDNTFFSTELLSGEDALAFGTIGFRCCDDIE